MSSTSKVVVIEEKNKAHSFALKDNEIQLLQI